MSQAVSVNIKMYRVKELGDCFLLRFKNGNEKSHVLIDCGSFRNGQKSIDRMKKIAEDIEKQLMLEQARLDVVVGTHQHNDHLSGFVHAQQIFKKMAPEQVWLSWLDNPNDKQAVKIGEDFNNYLTSLRLMGEEMTHQEFANTDAKKTVDEMLGFFGVERAAGATGKKKKLPPAVPAEARNILRNLGKKNPQYLQPGQIFNLPGMPDELVKVYVLGPPKKEELLYDKDPNKDETYDPELTLNMANSDKLLNAMKKFSGSIKEKDDNEPFPFNEPYRASPNYKKPWSSYYNPLNKWRQITLDWLSQAEQLALWLDSYTNNSSLVLAFQIVKTNKVLLFAADAQTGNWNSWKEIKWKKAPAGFNWMELMQNTVLYKVGHHCSHNATLVEGLKNMNHKELVAMIPVDKTDPNIKKKNGWKMPAANLFAELKKKSQNRVIRMDEGVQTSAAWAKLPFKPITTELYIEYEVRG
jgi:hypothetical protein